MRYDVVHNASVNFENDFICKILNKSEPSCLLEMVLSIIPGGLWIDLPAVSGILTIQSM